MLLCKDNLIYHSKEVCLEVNANMLLSHQNEEKHGIKKAKRPFENVAQFKYLGTTETNQSLIQEKIRRRLDAGEACYNSVQNFLSSLLLSKNVKIRIYKTTICMWFCMARNLVLLH
jgi:hypothetical protein